MFRQAANNTYNAHDGIASYTEKKDRNKYKKQFTKNWKESRDGVPKSIQTRVVSDMVTKVKGRPYFFVTIKRLISTKFQVSGK